MAVAALLHPVPSIRLPVARSVPARDGAAVFAQDAHRAGAAVGGQTLDDVLVDAWEGLAAHRSIACPVCAGVMVPRYGAAGHAPIGGRCGGCGSTLS